MPSEKKSILCPRCRRLISSDEPACPYCGLSNPGAWWKRRIFKGLLNQPEDIIRWLIYANAALYLLSILLNPSRIGLTMNPLMFLSPSGESLFLLGATGTIPLSQHYWWTLVSASFLHGNLLHIVFNMLALRQLGPFLIQEFGFSRFSIIYTLSGIIGFLVSWLGGVPFTLGASACLTGLIGAILYYGKSRGGFFGQVIYRQAMGWVVGLVLFGLVFPGINNWAHGGGLLAGIFLAYLFKYLDRRPEAALDRFLGSACLVLTVVILAWVVFRALLILLVRAA